MPEKVGDTPLEAACLSFSTPVPVVRIGSKEALCAGGRGGRVAVEEEEDVGGGRVRRLAC